MSAKLQTDPPDAFYPHYQVYSLSNYRVFKFFPPLVNMKWLFLRINSNVDFFFPHKPTRLICEELYIIFPLCFALQDEQSLLLLHIRMFWMDRSVFSTIILIHFWFLRHSLQRWKWKTSLRGLTLKCPLYAGTWL